MNKLSIRRAIGVLIAAAAYAASAAVAQTPSTGSGQGFPSQPLEFVATGFLLSRELAQLAVDGADCLLALFERVLGFVA